MWFATATADPRFCDLTGREKKVLALISGGLSNRQISAALRLAEPRVGGLDATALVKTRIGRQRRAPPPSRRHIVAIPDSRDVGPDETAICRQPGLNSD